MNYFNLVSSDPINLDAAYVPKMFVSCELEHKMTRQNGLVHLSLVPPADGPRQDVVVGICVDSSGSMSLNVSNTQELGSVQISRLDLTLYTVSTIIAMLGPNDTLYIVQFSSTAALVLAPTQMTDEGKEAANAAIKSVVAQGGTNILAGLKMLNDYAKMFPGRNVATLLLTDGQPSERPMKGDEGDWLQALPDRAGTLSTFGFGNEVDSALLAKIAGAGGGSSVFVADRTMVGTGMVNWCATTLATASLGQNIKFGDGTINTGLIQYGQTRDFIFPSAGPDTGVIAELPMARHELMEALRKCIATNGANSYAELYRKYSGSKDSRVTDLMKDIRPSTEGEQGQLNMASQYWSTWGPHYSRSYLKALENQVCINFKDAGLQNYGGAAFKKYRDEGEVIFGSLPPLVPRPAYGAAAAPVAAASMMQNFYNPYGGCFAPSCEVLMADGTRKAIRDIAPGDKVWTLTGTASVDLHVTLGSYNKFQPMCRIGKLQITPWHPILIDNRWVFPEDVCPVEDSPMPIVYNLVLSSGHIIDIEGTLSVTLGHGLTTEGVKHEFFGSRVRILAALSKQPGCDVGRPVYKNLSSIRDPVTKIITGWYDHISS